MSEIRRPTDDELPAVAALLDEYMRETFSRPWGGTLAALAADRRSGRVDLLVALRDGQPVAFAGWARSYDLHHCVSGAYLNDLFVRPAFRGRGVALELVAAVAQRVRAEGGVYVAGQAVGSPTTRQLYERVAMAFEGADCIVGGRAFRALADLAGRPPREMLKHLPRREWNYEP